MYRFMDSTPFRIPRPKLIWRNNSILSLDNYCLSELLEYLPLPDLCSFGSTCNQINKIASQFYFRYANLDANHLVALNSRTLISERKMEIVVKQMARHVRSFQISYTIKQANSMQSCETLIKLILLHCHNISELKIDFPIDDRFSDAISELENFQKLETLDIWGNIQLAKLNKIKNLRLTGMSAKRRSDLLLLKNLETLFLHFGNIDDLFSQLCDNNPRIKRIEIYSMSTSILNLIIDKLVYLEDFTLTSIFVTNVNRIANIKTLKKFTSCFAVPDLIEKLVKLNKLESLTYNPTTMEADLITKFTKLKYLNVCNFNDAQLNKLKSQRTLELLALNGSNDVTNRGVVSFVKSATNLKYLSLCRCTNCDKKVLKLLNDLINNHKRNRKLSVVCDFNIREPVENYPWLQVKVQRP